MRYSFTAFGHPNITSRHRNTFELTKEPEIGKEGDCIIGVKADFSLEKLKKFIVKKAKMELEIGTSEFHHSANGNQGGILSVIKNHRYQRGNDKIMPPVVFDNIKEEAVFHINQDFEDENELVVRKTDFTSKRTFGITADKAAKDFNREFAEKLKDPKTKLIITITAED